MTGDRLRQVGFVGLGDQGGPMALAIAEAGFPLHAWARRSPSYEVLSGVQFERHPDLKTLAQSVDVLELCLRDDQDITDLIETHNLLDALRPGTTVVNHGTGDPNANGRFGAMFASRDLPYLDAPVSGGRAGAIARTLTTMVGGARADFDLCRPVFESFSRKVAHMGPVGTGQLTKLLNNALTMNNLKSVSDVFDIAEQLDVDLLLLQEVVSVSSGSSAILEAVGIQIDEDAATHLQGLMRKDIEHFAEAMRIRAVDAAELRNRGIAGAQQVVDLAIKLRRR